MTKGTSAASKTIEPPTPTELRARIEAFLASGAGDGGSRALLGEALALLGSRALPTGMDVSSRNAVEDQLRIREGRFRRLLENASDGIALVTPAGEVLDLSAAAERIMGTTLAKLRADPSRTEVHVEDKPRVFRAFMRSVSTGGRVGPIRYRCRRTTGEWVWLETVCTNLLSDPEVRALVLNFRDITDQVAKEETLREYRAFLEKAQQVASIGSWKADVFSMEETLIWSRETYRIFGLDPDAGEIDGHKFFSMVHPEDRELVRDASRLAIEHGKPHDIDHRIILPDGRIRWVNEQAEILRDSANNPILMVGVVQDITDRKAATDALQRMNLDLELKVEARTSELQIQSNRRAALADLELAINTPAALQGVLRQIVTATSNLLPASAGCSVVLWDGETEKYTYCASSRGPYKEPLKSILRKRGGITRRIIDTRKPFCVEDVTVGPEAATRNPIVDARGVRAYAGVPMLLGDAIIGVMYAMESEPRVFLPEDIEFLTAMAQRAALAVSKVRLSDDLRRANEVLETEIARREVTRMELANAKVIADAARIEADRANRAKSEFLSRMSHELRTPLNAVLGFTQILEMQPLGEDDMKCVNHIAMAGAHLLNLINEVLDISRIESGKMSVSPEAIRLKDVLRQSLELVRPQLERRSIEIQWDTATCDGTWVSADPSRLRQVFLNLLSNAIKYNREGGSISLRCEVLDPERVRLYFADTGIGIPPNKIERIFTPFDRLGQESSGIEGSGLGLALSKRLVDVMRGNISVESLPGQGTTVMLDLRLAPPPSAFTETTSEMRGSAHPELLGNRARVLYVEDNRANIDLMQRILTSFENIELLTATEGATGLEIALRELPDVVILDLHLPDMSGAGVLNRLKANPSTCDTPVIIVSADASPGQIDDLLAAGANDYITKPINVQHFLNVLKGHLDGIRTEER